MKQIKNLTRRTLIYFSKLNGIFLNEEICKDINSSHSNTSKSNYKDDSQIIENTYKSLESKNKEENEILSNINNNISSVIPEEENKIFGSSLTDSKLKHKIAELNKKNSQNLYTCNKKININYNKSKKKTEKLYISNNINNFGDNSDFKKHWSPIPNENVVNSEIYPNEKFNDYKFLQSDFIEPHKNTIEIDSEKNLDKKKLIKYVDNELVLDIENEKKCENGNHSLEFNEKKVIKFENLAIVNIASTNVSSIYENLNQITKYKFSGDKNLRKKVIQFLMKESKKRFSNCSIVNSNISPKIKINNSLSIHQNSHICPETLSKHKRKLKNSKYDEEYPFIFSLSKEESSFKEMKSIHQIKKNSSKFKKLDSFKYMSPEISKSNIYKKNQSLFKIGSVKSLCRNGTEKLFNNTRKKYSTKKEPIQNLYDAPDDQELNFYRKMQTLRGNSNNIATANKNNELSKKNNYLDIISNNIIENQKTLNNPEEFYMDFFSNIVRKSINKRKKYNKNKKEFITKKTEETSKKTISNHKYLSDYNDDGKLKKNETTKRHSSPSSVKKRNCDN